MTASDRQERFGLLSGIVAAPNDLSLEQWHRLYERAIASRAALLIEVGRGHGNSTVVLTEAAHVLGVPVISVSNDKPPAFKRGTWPKLRRVVGRRWRKPLKLIQGDVQDFLPPPCERGFLFWDAHGPEVAEAMLNRVIPSLPAGSTVVVHDVSRKEPAHEGLYEWCGLVSPFEELPLLGGWLDEHNIPHEHDTGMLSFTV